MIVFDLVCQASGDVFEAWFSSSADYEDQSSRGLVTCPVCRSNQVANAPMAPRVAGRSGGETAIARLAALQAAMLKDSEWVGDRFTEEALAIHAGEAEVRAVHGSATAAQAKSLIDEGVPIAPLPLPVVPPNQVN